MIALDTNVISQVSKTLPDRQVVRWLQTCDAERLYLPVIVVMEQSYGAELMRLRSGSERYMRILEDLLATSFRDKVLPFDTQSSILTGRVRARRERMGRPISVQDAMIAAICLVHGATLATRNTKDFEGLDLALINPFHGA